jgi:hypothetical protein
MPLHPGPGARIFRISRLRVTYEVRKFPTIFIDVAFKIQMVFGSYINEIYVGNKTENLKDILSEVKFILVSYLHYNLKNIPFILDQVFRSYLNVVFACIFVILNTSI